MAEASASVMPAKQRAMIFCGLLIVATIASVFLAGGHPRSNWFYPYVLLIAVLACVRNLRSGDRSLSAGDDPPKTVAEALAWSFVAFVISGAAMYGYWNLLWPEDWTWPVAIFISTMAAVNYYRQKRGYAYSSRPMLLLFIVFLAALTISKWAGWRG
jgi:hypothetical protein